MFIKSRVLFIFAGFLAVFCVPYLSLNAQARKKKSETLPAASVKPSLQTTINYIDEKINTYGTDFSLTRTMLMTEPNSSIISHSSDEGIRINYVKLQITAGKPYLNSSIVKTFTSKDGDSGDKSSKNTFSAVAPLDQIVAVTIQPGRNLSFEDGYPQTTESGRELSRLLGISTTYLVITFSSDCVELKDSNGNVNHSNSFILGVRNGEPDLLEKLKRAFLNLQNYYPKKSTDPFAN